MSVDSSGVEAYSCSLCNQFRGKSQWSVLSHIGDCTSESLSLSLSLSLTLCTCIHAHIIITTYTAAAGAVHSHDANFNVMCGINGCTRTYRNYHSFRKHLRRCHCNVSIEDSEDPNTRDDGDCIEEMSQSSSEIESIDQSRKYALFLLKAKEIHKISQTALDELTSEFTELCKDEVRKLQIKVIWNLRDKGVDTSDISTLFSQSRLNSLFCGLHSSYLQDKYYEQILHLVVSSYLILLFLIRRFGTQWLPKFLHGR